MTFARSRAAAAAVDGVALLPSRLARGAQDRRVGGGSYVAAVEENVQDRKSTAVVVVGGVRLAGETRRLRTRPQREFQRDVSGGPAAPFPRPQQSRHVHVPPPAAVAVLGQQQVADERLFFPRREHAADRVRQTAVHADPHAAAGGGRSVFPRVPEDPHHRFDDCYPVGTPAAVYHRLIDRERDLREHDVTAAVTVV